MEGQTLSHYRVLEKLGGGGMGVVHKALDTHLDRHVALKLLPPELTRDDDARERFVLEAKAASALDHQNICTIYDIDETPDGQMFIAMGYYEGETLKKRIARGPLPIEEALDIATQVAQGLSKAHASGIVHRDIKPANVIVTTDGLVKIVDFGIAKLLGVTGPTQTGGTVGTVSYMSPEQLAGKDADQRADIWSLGAVLYEMLTGQQPFTGENEWAVVGAISGRAPAQPRSLRLEISAEVEKLVLRALEKQRRGRYQSAEEFLAATNACREEFARAVGSGATTHAGASLLTSRTVVPAVLVVILLAAFGIFWSAGDPDVTWAREEAIPEIIRLIDQDSFMPAVELAKQVEAILPDDPDLAELWPLMTIERGIQTEPEGVSVSYRSPDGSDDDWVYVGETPIEYARIPPAVARWRFEREGFNTAEFLSPRLRPTIQLSARGSVPAGMIRVASAQLRVRFAGFNPSERIQAGPFLVDQYEVTNAQFKEFMDAGGYDDPDYWTHQFVTDGQVVPWPEAMTGFRDLTGRPGPSTWQVGSYPDGEDMFPVRGVSWYEAAAYAEFRGKSLPTIYHWSRAASPRVAHELVPFSNFGNNVLPVGTTTGVSGVGAFAAPGVSGVGAFDMAGNVREWVWNEAQSGQTRYILGGSWSDPTYQFQHADTRSPFDRSEENGFRLVQYLGDPQAPLGT